MASKRVVRTRRETAGPSATLSYNETTLNEKHGFIGCGKVILHVLRWERDTLPCGYVKGVHEALVAGIPGLKSETWGTLRVFPVILVRKEDLFLPYLRH